MRTGILESVRLHNKAHGCNPSLATHRFQRMIPSAAVQNDAPITSKDIIRPHLRELSAYKPIEPFEVLSAKLGRRPEDIVKLDANENPYGPPPEVLEALGGMKFPNIYPDPESRALRKGLAEWHGVPMEHLLVGCGADELIDLLMRCVLDPGDKIIDCPPTFTMYKFDAAVNAAQVVTVPRLPGFKLDIEGIRHAVLEEKPKIIFLTSPNNPDGSTITTEELEAILDLPVLVVLDEAYIEFSREPSRIQLVESVPNLVVMRTFSKCAALAGLRVGYAAFPLDLVEYMWRAKQPYNVSVAAEVAATAALSNMDYMNRVRDALVKERERLYNGLKDRISFLEPSPSESNFILCRVLNDRNAAELRDVLAERYGIMVRHYATKELNGFVRISVGLPEHTEKILSALEEIDKE